MSVDEKSQPPDEQDEESKTVASKESDNRSKTEKKPGKSNRVLLVPYPKFVFMYPTVAVAFIAWIVLLIRGSHLIDPDANTVPVVMTALFLAVMMANMFVIVFDFPRATSLTLVFVVTSLALGLWMLTIAKPDILPSVAGFLTAVRPAANTSFFGCISVAMMLMYVAVFISVRFNYWELRNNELLHHHGFLSDLKRYPAPNLRVDKEINDVFEYMLLGAGRLTLHPTTEKRAIVLDNILFVSDKERQLMSMLGSIKVKIGGDSDDR